MKPQSILVVILALGLGSAYAQKDDVLKYSLKTKWSAQVDPNHAWSEYPRPQMTRDRDSYINLNGYWAYAIRDKSKSRPKKYQGRILVPFAAESELSGVKRLVGEDNYLWYKRAFKAPELGNDERLLLHFGAVDWEAKVSVNGHEVGTHKGGYDAFSFDITDHLKRGDQEVVVRVWDPSDKGTQARGKQVSNPFGIWYTPVTGIWQTVWLEKVPQNRIILVKPTPDIDQGVVKVAVRTITQNSDLQIKLIASAEGKKVVEAMIPVQAQGNESVAELNIENPRLWSPDDPFLYDLKVALVDAQGAAVDEVGSYFGMRKVSLGKDAKGYTRILLNNRPLFQFGLLDQGWWPDGLYTPPTEEAMLYDVEMTKKMGFNMLRKHVKVECPRFYYQCDKIGMLVWQDMPNGNYLKGLRIQAWETKDAERPKESADQFEAELKAMMDQFHGHPSILVWVPFNEGWGQYDTERVTHWVKNYDPSRLVDSPSGWADREVGDVIDVHLYPGPGMEMAEEKRAAVLGEFGGLGYPVKDHLWWDKRNWGYLTYETQDEYAQEFEKLINSLKGLISTGLSAAIYTQTTDVEGEVNGLITYDRERVKIDPAKMRDMVLPLYREYWDAYVYLPHAEHQPIDWKVSRSQPEGEWAIAGYDDFSWETQKAPFSTYDNFFLDHASNWDGEPLFLRKVFHVNVLPQQLYMKHYLPKAKVKIYLNGELLMEQEDGGGRKRHYTDVDISDQSHLIKEGKNVLAVELYRSDQDASFDMGLYTTDQVESKSEIEKNPSPLIRGGKE